MSSELYSYYCFDDFYLDVENRQLWKNGEQIDLSGRYFDALVLLIREHGNLVEKDQFFTKVWDDIVVSDSALTQCIKELRRKLGDNAANPRYIETISGYGYRFIGPVKVQNTVKTNGAPGFSNMAEIPLERGNNSWLNNGLLIGGTGTVGGMAAGLIGGLFYGFCLAYLPGEAEMGAMSILLVLTLLCIMIGSLGGLGVSFGMSTAMIVSKGNRIWT
ncbi:MAG: transcriptional regulator, partial [Balneolaceae bacterium]|nr:transcriptional regulator [Balneolaceae bacterium]